ncbi:caveolae-associated protein 2a [Pholidichthys leucotaenia]
MEEEAPHPETGSSVSGSSQTIPQQQGENPELLIPSFSPSSAPSSPTPTGTLSRLGLRMPGASQGAVAPGSPVDRGQVSAITVVALLDKLVNMMESVEGNQQRMEQRQAELEAAVRTVQGDVTRLSKAHLGTSVNVNKLLERSRKVSGNLKEVRERLDKQGVQVKKLEANHSHLLKRNHFKVLIFQEDNEIPTSVAVQDSLKTPVPSQYDAESTHPTPSVTGSVDGFRPQDETLQTISLSSEEEGDLMAHRGEDEMLKYEASGAAPRKFERRADAFKRNSLKKVDSLKKAFSPQSIEKKVNQFTKRIVPPEKREKLIRSFSANHPKSPTAKTSSFKVTNMTFNVKKVRDGQFPSQEIVSPSEEAHVEIPPLGSTDGEVPVAEVYHQEIAEMEMLTSSTPDSMKAELAINGKAPSVECEVNGDHAASLAVPEHVEDVGLDEEEEAGGNKEKSLAEAAGAAAAGAEAAVTVVVEQVS